MAYQVPHRNPMPHVVSPPQAQYSHLQPDPHQYHHYASPLPSAYAPQHLNTSFAQSRARPTPMNAYPNHHYQQQHQQQQQQQQQFSPGPPPHTNTTMNNSAHHSRRTPSTATFSTTASSSTTAAGGGPNDVRRSTSSRSGNSSLPPASSTSYVALMRRQKATVWSERAQHEDPRLLAQQRQAKLRAAQEVTGGGPHQHRRVYSSSHLSASTKGNLGGGGGSGASSGGGIIGVHGSRVTAKIRHHGKAGLVGYSPGDIMGGVGGVPMRLSASEVEGGDSDGDSMGGSNAADGFGYGGGAGSAYHHRSGSARSSLGSFGAAKRGHLPPSAPPAKGSASSGPGRWSSSTTPTSEGDRTPVTDDASDYPAEPLDAETPVPGPRTAGRERDYFAVGDGNCDASGGERADAVPALGAAAARLASSNGGGGKKAPGLGREKSLRNPEDLRRRGSVDERSMTMTAGMGRLFIANPDAGDSD